MTKHALRSRSRILAGMLALVALWGAACSAPRGTAVAPPSKAEAIADVRAFLESQRDAILGNPAGAPQAIRLVEEFLEPMAAHYGPPIADFLDAVRQVRVSWGPKPTKAAVERDVASLSEKAAALAP
jgi:hypothetical protein